MNEIGGPEPTPAHDEGRENVKMPKAHLAMMPAHERSFQNAAAGDGRSAPRMRLVYRTAKLVLEGSEIFCVIRNVSRTGVNVQLFGDIRLPDAMVIELVSGLRFRIAREWQQDRRCGASFKSPIDVEEFLTSAKSDEKRRSLRARVMLPVVVREQGMRREAMLVDLGIGGARLSADDTIWTGTAVDLIVDGMETRAAAVQWVRNDGFGIQFASQIPFVELAGWLTGLAIRRASSND